MNAFHTGLDGLHRAETTVERSASRLARFHGLLGDSPEDVVELSAEAVSLLAAENAYEANLKVIESAAELEQSTLDILG